MARAATIPPQVRSPPKRVTRASARTRGATAKAAAAAKVAAEEPVAVTAPRPRGRPAGAATTKTAQKDEQKKKPGRKPATAAAPAEKVDVDMVDDDHDDDDDNDDDDDTDDEIGFATAHAKKAPASAPVSRGKVSSTSSVASKASTAASRGSRNATTTTTNHNNTAADSGESDDDELAQVSADVPKRKVGRPRTKPAPEATAARSDIAAKPTRGRPRTVTKAASTVTAETDAEKKVSARAAVSSKAEPKTSRTTAATTAPTASSLAKSSSLKDPPKKKKVTFQDVIFDSDKENLPVAASAGATTGKKASTTAPPQTGLKAKPVRKAATAAATATSTRGRKPAADSKTAEKEAAQPLSPKKATQVAKSRSGSFSSSQDDGEDDELSGAKTTVKLVVRSPTKNNDSENFGLSSPVKKVNFTGSTTPILPPKPADSAVQNNENGAEATKPPVDFKDSVIMASPARRLPPSPWKDSIRETPRRGPLFIKDQSSKQIAPPDFAPMQTSPLKSSPKKASILAASFAQQSQSPLKAPSTPGKASLLKSPARRLFTPLKMTGVTPRKSSVKGEAGQSEPAVTDGEDENVASKLFGGDASADSPAPEKARVSGEANDEGFEVEEKKEVNEDFDMEEKKEAADVFVDDPFVDKPEQSFREVEEEPLQLPDADEDGATEDVDHAPAENPTRVSTQDFEIHVDPEDEVECADPPVQEEALPSAGAEVTAVASPPVSPYEVAESEETRSPLEKVCSIPPPAPWPSTMAAGEYRNEAGNESDDEATAEDSPCKNRSSPSTRGIVRPETPTPFGQEDDQNESMTIEQENTNDLGFTPLADQLSQWKASSPEKAQTRRRRRKGVFSLGRARRSSGVSARESLEPYQRRATRRSLSARRSSLLAGSPVSADQQTSVEAEMAAHEEDATAESHEVREGPESHQAEEEQDITVFEDQPAEMEDPQPQDDDIVQDEEEPEAGESEDETVYGDENVPPPAEDSRPSTPVQPAEDEVDEDKENHQDENTPLPLLTPVKPNLSYPREIHTVTKVPLKPEGPVSPLKMPRKRTRSLSGSPARSSPRLRALDMTRIQTAPSLSPRKSLDPAEEADPVKKEEDSDEETVQSYTPKARSTTTSPSKTPQRNNTAEQGVLRGAVVYVDVHTSEGEDASGIFIELLTQMGAKCVKTWSWNPRSSLSPDEGGEPREKVGITHVIFKDGGVRTLEKVRAAGGLVKCVGVGWVLEYVSPFSSHRQPWTIPFWESC